MAARVGLFLGRGDQAQDANELSWSVSDNGLKGPVFRIAHPDTEAGAADLVRLIRDNDLTGFVAASCPPLNPEGACFKSLNRAGLDPEMGFYLDLGPEDRLDDYLARPQTRLALTQALAAQLHKEAVTLEPFAVSTRVLVLGADLPGLRAARELARSGYEVCLLWDGEGLPAASPLAGPEGLSRTEELVREIKGNDRISLYPQTSLIALRGAVGRFRAFLTTGSGEAESLEAGAVVVSQGPPLKAGFQTFGAEASKRIIPLSRAVGLSDEELKALAPEGGKLRIGLAAGVGAESEPLNLRGCLTLGLRAVNGLEGRALLLTGNAKVAAPDLEELTQKAKAQGLLMAKLTQPKVSAVNNGESVSLTFFDEVLGNDISQDLDLLVIDENPAPDQAYQDLAGALGLALGPDGCLQPDQVNALPIMTPRSGLFTIGPAQGRVDLEEQENQARAAAMAIRNLLKDGSLELSPPVEIIDTGKCAVCLTCVRVCPEGAMITDLDKPASNPLACTGCGTCASECPQDAIIMRNQNDDVYTAQISAAKAVGEAEGPEMLVFACSNSAAQALARARRDGWEGPAGARYVQVPCASKIDPAFVLQAFSEGFDGVLILSCYEDACYSLKGNTWLGYRADHLQTLLTESGIEPERIRHAGVAPSMKQEPTALVEAMAEELARMGPAGLRPGHREMLARFTLELGEGLQVST